MTDVLKIALERRSKLQEEVDRLDDFIRMAETLIRGGGASSGSSTTASAPKPAVEETGDSPMHAAARRLTETEPRRTEGETAETAEMPRPSIIRRGLAG